MLQEKAAVPLEQIAKEVQALIVTRGGQGSVIFTHGKRIEIPPVTAERIVDPTGCGDAYRAGLLYGIANRLDWPVTGRLASILGAIKIAARGAQNHRFTPAEVEVRYREAFGAMPW